MGVKENIARAEQEFPRLFANYVERPYGVLFYNEKIPDHHDSNHAILYTGCIDDLSAVLGDIRDFYEDRGIAPAVYHPSAANNFVDNIEAFKKCGYAVTIGPDRRIMVLNGECEESLTGALRIERITDVRIIESGGFLVEPDEYLKEIYSNCIGKSNHYLFVGYLSGLPVTLLSFHVSEYGCTRFDEMKTAKEYMGRGFAREMNRFAASFCARNHLPPAYQWPAHGTSERITAQAGFVPSFTLPSCYATYAVEEHYTE